MDNKPVKCFSCGKELYRTFQENQRFGDDFSQAEIIQKVEGRIFSKVIGEEYICYHEKSESFIKLYNCDPKENVLRDGKGGAFLNLSIIDNSQWKKFEREIIEKIRPNILRGRKELQREEKREEQKEEKRKKLIINLLKEKAIKIVASDIAAFLKEDIDEVKELCEALYDEGKIDFAGNGRYFILSEEKETPKKATAKKTESVADEIKKFKELLDAGAITQEEYEAKKKELLGL